jgi:hypothetical protein
VSSGLLDFGVASHIAENERVPIRLLLQNWAGNDGALDKAAALFAVVLMRREVLYNPARCVIDFCKALVVVAHTARQFITAVM